MTAMEWQPGSAFTRWSSDIPQKEFDVANFTTIGISQLATEFVLVPVSATKNGAPYDPTADPVVFAFMPTPTQVPQLTDWVAGTWETDATNVLYPHSAKCLVGPGGAIVLGIGTYIIYIKITDSPEIPVLIGGQLQVS